MSELQLRSAQAQTAVIGAMLIDDRCIGDVMANLGEEDFPAGVHKSTFLAIRKLFLEGRPVDPLTVLEAMQGGTEYRGFLRECMEVTPTAANVLEYCRMLREATRMSRLNELGGLLQVTGSREAAEGYIAKINALMVDQRDVRLTTAAEAARNFLERMQAEKAPEYLKWGLAGLDEHLYTEAGDMILLGGYPSSGKTLLSIMFALFQSQTKRVGYYSLETRTQKVVDRAISSVSQVKLEIIKKRAFSRYDWGGLTKAATEYAKLHLDHIDAAGMTVADIESLALSRRHEIVYIDYLQLLKSKGGNRYEEVTNISKDLHLMAQRHGITVVALSQLSRPEKNKIGQTVPPSMASFRESGQIEQDADAALLLWPENPDDYRSDRKLKIGKNKEGRKGLFTLRFMGETQTMLQVGDDNCLGQEVFAPVPKKEKVPF